MERSPIFLLVLGGSGIGDDGVSALACRLSKYRMDLMLHGAAQLIIIHVFFCPTSGDEDFQRRGLQRSTAYVEDHKSYAVISSVLICHFSPPLRDGTLSLVYYAMRIPSSAMAPAAQGRNDADSSAQER